MAKPDESIQHYLKHIRFYGGEGIMQVAAQDTDIALDSLVSLQEAVDAHDAKKRGYKKPRKSAKARVQALLGIESEEGA